MIMKISNFNKDIVISDEYIRVLEIEDKHLFANIVNSVHSLCNAEDSREYIVLSEGDKELTFSRDAYLVLDILNIDFNERKIINKLYSKIKLLVNLDLEVRNKLDIYFMEAFNLLDTILIDFPFEFAYKPELEIEDLFKLYGIRIYNEGQSFMEKILCLIDLISLLDLCKILIFCNLKSFFTDIQIEEIYKQIIYSNLQVLLIEGHLSENALNYEKKIRIDYEFEDYEV